MTKKGEKKEKPTEKAKEEPQPKKPLKERLMDLYTNKLTPSIKIFIRMNTYQKQHLPLLISAYLCMFINSILDTYSPNLIGEITDVIHAGQGEDGLFDVCISFLKLLLTCSFFGILKDWLFGRLSRKVEREMREEYFNVLLNKDISFFDDSKTGEIGSKLTKDIATIKTSITSDVVQILMKVINIVGSLYLSVMISFKLTLILFLLTLPRSAIIWKFGFFVKSMKKEQHKQMNEANGFAIESFMNIRVVKTFSTEEKELSKYVKKLEDAAKIDDAINFKTTLYSSIKIILQNLSQIGLIWYGGYLVINSQLTIGQLTRFITFSGRLVRSVNTIDLTVKKLFTSMGAAEDIYDQIDSVKKLINEKTKGISKETLRGEIEFKEVSFSYPTSKEIKVYDKLSISIKPGDSVALVGASGSGKSTFVSLLLRLYDATEGSINIDGDDIKSYNLKWLHSQIGYVSQEPSLFSGTLEDNITYGLTTYNDDDIDEAITQAHAKVFIKNKDAFPKGLQTKVAERGLKLSGGQKQRIAIARALIKKPKILIFDEATSALDSQSESQVQAAIDSILTKGEKTMIIIAHRLSTVINCKRILVFQEGKIVEEGNHQTLLEKNGVYSELVKTQLSNHNPPVKKVLSPLKLKPAPKRGKRESSPISEDETGDDGNF